MNLYIVYDSNYDWGCFVFETTRNKAKKRAAEHFFMDYIDMRCKTLKKGVNFPYPKTVDSEDDEGYSTVLALGHHYANEAEMYSEEECWRAAE
jgi:hypothetical protein